MNEPHRVTLPVNVEEILQLLPHRYPFLLVDRVLELTPDKRLKAIKNVTINEPFFQGHFPGHPVMPGVLIIEALAQACGLLIFLSAQEKNSKRLFYLVKVDNAKFSALVQPGDQLILDVELRRTIRKMGQFICRAFVGDKQVAEAELLCAERPQ
ncbi:MAG: 3-hydroxyacyl-ACP dehydratase FabZ [Rudaea sp.]